ncbi:MAG: serine/threonine-protein phosphatase [Gammaproteobacteria bacterium]|nr:MAG: serine/threonine-protein phosphatase [Gammaproteobacteria bacterium]RKZ76361.1 MAG: serine/threonine-protein phosphatase [Gammaproteobacteria bacterium]
MAKQLLYRSKNYAGNCIQGERNYQEDDFSFDNSQQNDFLIVLADGMGGHQGGAVASRCAVDAFKNHYHTVRGEVAKRLYKALLQANHQLLLKAQSQPKLKGMGCTLVGVAIHDSKLEWISVGDSPLWLYSAGRLRRLNADHSMKPFLQEQVKLGELTPQEAAIHPDRNMLLSALVGTQIDLIDQSAQSIELYPGDRVLLASDGILTLSNAELSKILAKPLSIKKLVNKLLEAVKDKAKPAQDNTTALVVEVPNEFNPVKKQAKFGRWQTRLFVLLLILNLIFWASLHF